METKFGVVESKFNYKGHECLVVFTCRGVRNGYVSYNHIIEYDRLDIDCHGGLTFSGQLPDYYEPTKKFYIGFDCGHYCDGNNYEQAYKYGLIDEEDKNFYVKMDKLYPIKEEVRTKEYVEQQCRYIVDQIVKEKE